MRRRRLREQGRRSLAANLAEACSERVPLEVSRRRAAVTAELRLRELLDRLAAAEVRFAIVDGLAVKRGVTFAARRT